MSPKYQKKKVSHWSVSQKQIWCWYVESCWIPTSDLLSRSRSTVNFLFWIFWLTTLHVTAFCQFFIKKTYTGPLTDILKHNLFPSHLIDKTFKQYLNKPSDQKSRNSYDENNTPYFKLRVIGQYSRIKELKLWRLLKCFCETDLDVKLSVDFTSYKIKNIFSFKDHTPDALKSMVVYQFPCVGCNSFILLKPVVHFSTRIKVHK